MGKDKSPDKPATREKKRQPPEETSSESPRDVRPVPLPEKIREPRGNLTRRADWFRKRHGPD
jgi:hypothetical protein